MRIAYCTNVRLPNERAHGHQVAAVVDALAKLGHEVTVFAPYRKNPITEDFTSYHHIDPRVRIRYMNAIDPIGAWYAPGMLGLWLLNVLMRRNLRSALKKEKFDLLYTRTPALLPALSDAPVVAELHTIPSRNVGQCNRCKLVVCLTSVMRDELKKLGVSAPMIVEGDAVDVSQFSSLPDPVQSKKKWGVEETAFVVGYAGQLESMGLSKGIPELIGAVRLLIGQGKNVEALIAGGPEAAQAKLVSSLPADISRRIHFVGHLPHSDIPAVFSASNVLVYPAPASDHPFYNRDTSPLKLLEYMASGKPVISADLPPLKDIIDDSVAFLCPPGDSQALAKAISEVMEHPETASQRVLKAKERVAEHTWEKRMGRIVQSAQV